MFLEKLRCRSWVELCRGDSVILEVKPVRTGGNHFNDKNQAVAW